MCLIVVAWRVHPRWPLVLAGNRDEFHARPTLALAPWAERPDIVGGRDALHGGSWLAVRGRRLAAVTNVRLPHEPDGRSRGHLVRDFVGGAASASSYADALRGDAREYRPFNLLVHDGGALAYAGNRPAFSMQALAPGLHGLSNGPLDAPWPKVEALRAAMAAWLDAYAADHDSRPHDAASLDRASHGSPDIEAPDVEEAPDIEPLFAALADPGRADDARLPDTGVGLERERFLSSAFIAGDTYGTRASTVVLVSDADVRIVERRFGPRGTALGETRHAYAIAAGAATT
ncbi:NRDE family protein [Tolypothrix campylonemoides VB511288]|nr:NRDE family protein [Tolypothrix campylonemoides VB511288]